MTKEEARVEINRKTADILRRFMDKVNPTRCDKKRHMNVEAFKDNVDGYAKALDKLDALRLACDKLPDDQSELFEAIATQADKISFEVLI